MIARAGVVGPFPKSTDDAQTDSTTTRANRLAAELRQQADCIEAAARAQAALLRAHADELEAQHEEKPVELPGLLTKKQLARVLGISVATVDRDVRLGMPHEIVNRRKRFDLAACRAWLGEHKVSTSIGTRRPPSDDGELDDLDLAAVGLRRVV